MKKFVFALLCFVCCGVVEAKPRNNYTTNKVYGYTSYQTSSAQGVAEIMASKGYVGHFGGNNGYEGCGSGFSQQQAYNNCCYSKSGMTTIDVGYAQGKDGRWYCCRRYR
jgi:hypothetical protein